MNPKWLRSCWCLNRARRLPANASHFLVSFLKYANKNSLASKLLARLKHWCDSIPLSSEVFQGGWRASKSNEYIGGLGKRKGARGDLWEGGRTLSCGWGQGVRISRLPYPYLLPPVPFCPASPAPFTGNILYCNRACAFFYRFKLHKQRTCQGELIKGGFLPGHSCHLCILTLYVNQTT